MWPFKKREPGEFFKKILSIIVWLEWFVKVVKWFVTLLRTFPPIPSNNENTNDITPEPDTEPDD